MRMKNKNEDQKEQKKKHKELLKRTRRKEPKIDRKDPTLTEKPTILIVCEGENTEPSYPANEESSTTVFKLVKELNNYR